MDDNKFKTTQTKGEIEEIEDEVEKRFKLFKNFDLTILPPHDHHFKLKIPAANHFVSWSSLSKRIIQEQKLLRMGLPDSIFVRANEWRKDLMRAVIIGPSGSLYSNSLFFFDIFFPSSYPLQPPRIFYFSPGLEVNPFLQPNGKVCLSILNTSEGRREEKWNPKQSTLLQVLISIQDSLLTAKPYLNEPCCIVYDNELLKYNNDAFMQTCEAMLYTLKMPPTHFEDFVAGHFRNRAHPILMNFRACVNVTEPMSQLVLNLIKAFEKNGTYCKHHVGQLKTKEEPVEQKIDNNGLGTRVWSKLKILMDL